MLQPWTDAMVSFLQEVADADPAAFRALIEHRVPCNDRLADHPTVQVGPAREGKGIEVGMLGVLNGFCGTVDGGRFDGWGGIAAELKEDGTVGVSRTDSIRAVTDLSEITGD